MKRVCALDVNVFTLLLALSLFSLTACGGGGSTNTNPPPPPPGNTATPLFSPAQGTFSGAQNVTITDSTSGATIYYTTDGSTPTTSSTKYTAAIPISATGTLRAMAASSGNTDSSVATAVYMIASGTGTSPSYTWNNAQIIAGGFITGIVFHPAQANLAYVRTDIGGAYRWNNATQKWVPLTDWITPSNWNYTGIESIGIDPSDPQRLYLAAGTYIQSWAPTGAILVSADQGNTFTTVAMPFKIGGNENGRQAGERLAVDPNDGSIVYFGSRQNGLWKSTNHGANWSQVSTFPVTGPTTGAKNDGVGVIFVNFIKSSGTTGSATPIIYVGVSDTGTETTPVFGLYRSVDSGATWQAVPSQPTGLYPTHGVFGPDGNLYLSYGDDVGPNGMSTGAIYKYTPPPNSTPSNAGTWANITPPFPNQAGFGAVSVDTQAAGTVMVSTLDRWGPHDDIYRSVDGGTNWTALGALATQNGSLSPWINILQPTPLGWWMGALSIDPFDSNHVMYGTGATLWESHNATLAATSWGVGADGIEETAAIQLISPPSGPSLVSALGDICGFVHTTLTSSPPAGMMVNPQFSSTTGLDFAQSTPTIMARVGFNGNASQQGAYSTNGGTNWTPFPAEPTTTNGAGTIAVSADGSTFVWAPSDGATAYTKNNGTSWTASAGAPGQQTVVADRFNSNKFYIAGGGSLYVSTNGGATFSVTNSALPGGGGKLFAAPTLEGDLWLTTSGGLYRSADSGSTFVQVSGVQSGNSMGFGKAMTGATYPALYLFGTVSGTLSFFRSVDGGATWVVMSDAQHQYATANVIIGDPRIFGRVYIGANGRGVIYGDSPN